MDSTWVEVCLRNEAIIAWDVCCGLCCSNSQLMVLISLRLRFSRQFGTWIVPVCSNRLLELSLEVAALRRVGLTVIAPKGSLRSWKRCRHLGIIGLLHACFPIGGCAAKIGLLVLFYSPWHDSVSQFWVVFSAPRIRKQLWLIHEIVIDTIVCIFGWNLVVTRLDCSRDALVIIGTEALVIRKASVTTCLLMCSCCVIISFQGSLSGLEARVWLISTTAKSVWWELDSD